MAHSIRLWLKTQYWVRIPVRSDICHRGGAYSVKHSDITGNPFERLLSENNGI